MAVVGSSRRLVDEFNNFGYLFLNTLTRC
jgi:hypothetical protein